MALPTEITQRDLRVRSKEIMDAVERGDRFTVTRHGHQIGELVPLPRRPRLVSRAAFASASRLAAGFDPDRLRAEQQDTIEHSLTDPYGR